MRPYVIGGACHRVQKQLDQAMSEGVLALSPELGAHASRCPQCAPQVHATEALFHRLRSAPAGFDLGPVPGVVDGVLQQIAAPAGPVATPIQVDPVIERARRRQHLRWVATQIATAAAVLAIALGGTTYLVLRVNHAMGGARPAEVVGRWFAPVHDWTQAIFRSSR